jgi:malic enzyme
VESYRLSTDDDGELVVDVPLRGRRLLSDPIYNKGTAFTATERRELGLEGLLPKHTTTYEIQLQRAYANLERKTDALERYIGCAALQDRNEALFYGVLGAHIEELLPIVYTPTVGLACQRFSHIFRRGRGLWITPEDKGRIHEVLDNAPFEDVHLIVATDNERILGLGDQGAGGMGIPIGKLALYTVAAGIHPTRTLPISIDVGTDNEELLGDELYVGWRRPRLRGAAYDELIEEFVEAVKARFPHALLQWEDFKKANAFALLHRYQKRILSFNDDIQGTAAVALAGVLAACRKTGTPLAEQRIVILGAGAAGVGIAHQLRDALSREGVHGDDLFRHVAVLDSKGLLIEGESNDPHKDEFRWPRELATGMGVDPDSARDLMAVVRAVQPTVLIGTSGHPGSFDQTLVQVMAAHCDHPVILPFSNPTAKAEAVPEDLLRWTNGKAIVATGSPFDPVEVGGRTVRIGQGNNVYVFPGVGLGAIVADARRVTDSMFTVAAHALAESVTRYDLDEGSLYPRLTELKDVTKRIAFAVAKEAARVGVADKIDDDELERRMAKEVWTPGYARSRPV